MTVRRQQPAAVESRSRGIQSEASVSTPAAADRVALTVVVVPFGGPDVLRNCLDALASQINASGAIEVVVPWPYTFGSVSNFAAGFPSVRFIEPTAVASHAGLRALGCDAASGEILALTEAQCIPDSDWCSAIISAHSGKLATIGGVVEKKVGKSAAEWAVYLADYGRYMNPMTEGPANSLSDVNVSYRTSALHAVRATWAVEFHEHIVHSALRDQGEPLWQSPRLIVRHHRPVRLADLMHERFQHARAYAGTRVATAGFATRFALAAASAVLPLLLILRVALVVARKRRHAARFLVALPSLTVLAIAWSCGELAGYLTSNPGELAPLSEARA